MDTSVSRLDAPVSRGFPEARTAIKCAADECQKMGHRSVGRTGEDVQKHTQHFKKQHPVATNCCKSLFEYAVKAVNGAGQGIQAAARRVVSAHNQVSQRCQSAKQHIETRFQKVAIATNTLSQFALNPITHIIKGLGLGLSLDLTIGTLFSVPALAPILGAFMLEGAIAGAGYGLAKAALNSARYALRLEGPEQHPYLAKAVGLHERALRPVSSADRFMEGLHPALSIPYKALKECTLAAVNVPAAFFGGVLGVVAVENFVVSLSNKTYDKFLNSCIALAVAKPVWNTGKFAYQRILEHMQPKELQPVFHFRDEPGLDSMV